MGRGLNSGPWALDTIEIEVTRPNGAFQAQEQQTVQRFVRIGSAEARQPDARPPSNRPIVHQSAGALAPRNNVGRAITPRYEVYKTNTGFKPIIRRMEQCALIDLGCGT
jgi:hypothetical protein